MGPIDPLDDKISKIEVIDYMGGDLTTVNSARVSMSVWHDEMQEKDEGLISYLARNNHISPFFHSVVQLRIKMPIFVARQHFKSQIGVARNEVSRRYVKFTPEVWVPKYFRVASKDIKQGSLDVPHPTSNEELIKIKELYSILVAQYEHLIEIGVAPEQARTILPQAMYTEFIETGSLAYYARYVGLRDKSDAQKEIQEYAKGIDVIMQELFPVSWSKLKVSTE